MNCRRPLVCVVGIVWVAVLIVQVEQRPRAVTQVQESPIARAQRALGGEQRIVAVSSLAMSGVRTNGTTSNVEYLAVFPEQFVRVEVNERAGYKLHTGFNRLTPILDRRPIEKANDTLPSASSTPPADHVDRQRVGLTQLLIGMFADSKRVLDVSYRAENATAITVTGPSNFSGTLDLDEATGLPIRFRYMGEVHVPQLAATPDSKERRRTMEFASRKGEITLTFEDRREVDGVLVPHRIRRTIPGQTLEDVRFDRIALNAKLDAASFRVQ